MKNRIKIFIVCFVLMCMSIFTGCSLVEADNDKLYNGAVAVIYDKEGKKIADISNRELLSGYESYGSMYVQYQGYSVSQAVDMTLAQIENRKIILDQAAKKFNINFETGEGFNTKELTYLYESTQNSILDNLDSYYDDIVNNNDEDEEEDAITFNGYTKNAQLTLEDGKYVIKKQNYSTDYLKDFYPSNGDKSYYNQTDKKMIYDNFIDKALSSKQYTKALKFYINDLKSAEYGMDYSKNTKELIEREIDRLYTVNYENYLIQKYSDENKNDSELSSIDVSDILSLYSSKVRSAYVKYEIENNSSYDDDIKNSLKDVYYFKNDNATKYFKVVNILFQFNEKQQEKYTEIENKKSSADYYPEYNNDLNDLYNQIVPKIRELDSVTNTYVETDKVDTVDNIIKKIKDAMAGAQAVGDVNYLGDVLNNLIYTYNEDPGMFNAESNYIIGVDENGNAVSSFVESFNEAGLKLYNDGNGQIGDVEVARSNYGIHVLIYTGKCQNIFPYIKINENFDLNDSGSEIEGEKAIDVLNSTRPNILVDKTYFDVLYDEIYTDNFSYFEQANIESLRQEYEIKVYRGRFASSLKG